MAHGSSEGVSNRVLGVLTLILVLVDAGLVVINSIMWTAYRAGDVTAAEVAPFMLFAGSAAVGAVVMLLAAIALFRDGLGHRLAEVAVVLAGVRVVAIPIAVVVVVVTVGMSSVSGPSDIFLIVLSVFEAVVELMVARVAAARTRRTFTA
ncbi:hypothetical protein [Actinoplanes sichuanensis]|uniref:Uncharacterized protein n=1 Tax=Actinoplanes sichuanensis TaxID=512349 RepID=A0ABW4A6W0_9ACTN|nr:hypothetical protein [Actinoplanes sichuanensis]